jgi:hypothetical protein
VRNSKFFADMPFCSMWLSAVWVLMVALEMPVTLPGGMEGAQQQGFCWYITVS